MRTSLRLFLSGLLFFVFCHAHAQEKSVSGRVTSAGGSGLPGVNVVLKGTTLGTVTDVDGGFNLRIPEDGRVLTFSFIGFLSQDVEIANQSVINVILQEDVITLDELVVTAVGIERESRALGYSVEDVDGEKVQQVSEPDAIRSLQGKIPGVYIAGSNGAPGSATRMTIRGNSSLLNNNLPLFVVDGIPFDNQQYSVGSQLSNGGSYSNRAADIDPNNIESITVLKGGAAAALYGSRAANGVVLITTKTGSGNVRKRGFEVSFSSSYSLEEIAGLPDYQNTYGAGVDFAYGNVNGSWGPAFSELDSIPHWYGGPNGLPAVFPQFSTFDSLGNVTGAVNIPYVAQPDNVEDFLQRGHVFENSISITGGTGKSGYTAVISHLDQDGIVENAEFQRTSLSLGGNTELANGLKAGGTFTYVKSNTDGPPISGNAVGSTSITSRLLWMNRTWPINDLDLFPSTNPVTGGSVFPVAADNPVWLVDNSVFQSTVSRFIGNLNFSYDVFDWVNLSYKIGLNTYTDQRIQATSAGSVSTPIGTVTQDDIFNEEIESNFLITLNRSLTQTLDLTAVIGHNFNQRTNRRQIINGTGIVSPGIFDLDNTSAVVPVPSSNPGLENFKRRLHGLFFDISLGYQDWLFLNISGRNDWSSTLPEENRSFFYPAASASLVFTDALNLNSKVLTFGKLRAGYSRVGNDALPYLIQPTFGANPAFGTNSETSSFPFLGVPGASEGNATTLESNTIGDPNLSPEFTNELELGLDLQFFNNRIGLDFTYYNRVTTDQIVPISVPAVSGFTNVNTNIGEVTNEGVEIGLTLVPVQLDNSFRWDIYTSFTHNENTVEELGEDIQRVTLAGGFGDPTLELIPGQPYGVIFGSVAARDDEGNYLVGNNGWMFQSPDFQVIGDPNPDFLMNITNTFSWKGVSLNAVFDFRVGGDLYSRSVERMLFRGVTTDTENRETSVVIPGFLGDGNTGEPIRDSEGNKIPNNIAINSNDIWFNNLNTGSAGAEFSVFDATTFRLREVTLAYDFPQSLLQNTPIGALRLSLTGRNLWYRAPGFPEGTNFDPEVNTFGSTNAQGLEFSTFPTTRRYGVNLRITF